MKLQGSVSAPAWSIKDILHELIPLLKRDMIHSAHHRVQSFLLL
jgi:hypothetical protein